jgi:hypothetical protein
MYKAIWIASIMFFTIGCIKNKIEKPFEIAKSYCNCVEEEMTAYKDSLINIYDCEKKSFSNSRLLSIYMSTYDDYNRYEQATRDSAEHFFIKVRNITDTLCINKLDPKRIKKIPHTYVEEPATNLS